MFVDIAYIPLNLEYNERESLVNFLLCNVALFVSAQSHMEKGLQSISRSSTEAIINFLAGDELQGREAGFHGSRVASEYIVSLLQWIGVQPLNASSR